jgi:hypothetical protein
VPPHWPVLTRPQLAGFQVSTEGDEGGLGAKHPGGNHEGPAGGIANGHGLVALARSHDRKFLAMQRVEGVLDDNGGTYGFTTPSC